MKKYLPTVRQVTQEFLAVAIAAIGFAYLVSKSPKLKKLVRDYSTDD